MRQRIPGVTQTSRPRSNFRAVPIASPLSGIRQPTSINLGLTDGQTHDIALYACDYDNLGCSEQIQITNAATGTILDTETISSFSGGVYLQWKVAGNVIITITKLAGPNAVVNGVFADPVATTAAFVKDDTTTQGNWIGAYGSQGYDIVSGPTSLPSYAVLDDQRCVNLYLE